MFPRLSLILTLLASPAFADCAKIDTTKKDPDGIPYCPDVVKETSAFAIFSCAMKQAKSWHAPTQSEIAETRAMLKAYREHRYPDMLVNADKVGLQVCRVIDGDDKYLLFLTKEGKKNYNGAFFGLRDAPKVSNITIISPHVLTDNNHEATALGFQKTKARVLIQNGYKKSLGGPSRISDFSHTKDNLGYWSVKAVNAEFPGQYVLHMHGQSNPSNVLYAPFKSALADTFEKAVRANTNITEFKLFKAYYVISPPTSTLPGRYVQTEIPVRIYLKDPLIIAKIVSEFEKLPEVWSQK